MLYGIYPTSPSVINYKRHKVVFTSNRYHLRSPNTCVNIVKNPLGAMNRGAEFHLGLLTDDAMFTKFHLAGLGTLQQSLLC